MRHRSSILMAVAVASLACADAPTASVDAPLLPSEPMLSRGNQVTLATGAGKAELPAGFTALEFGFTALQIGNGRSVGAFRIFWANSLGTNDYRGVVTCVSRDPVNNRAWIGGIITHNNSTHPSGAEPRKQAGRDIWFRVVDNGAGPHSPPDRTTVAGFEGDGGIITSAEYCATKAWAAGDANTWPVIKGIILVH